MTKKKLRIHRAKLARQRARENRVFIDRKPVRDDATRWRGTSGVNLVRN